GRSRRADRPSGQPRRSCEPRPPARDAAAAAGGNVHGPVARALDRRRRDRGHFHVQGRMRALLLTALWLPLASSVLLMGAFFMLLLAGAPRASAARRGDEAGGAGAPGPVLVGIGSGTRRRLVRDARFATRLRAAVVR